MFTTQTYRCPYGLNSALAEKSTAGDKGLEFLKCLYKNKNTVRNICRSYFKKRAIPQFNFREKYYTDLKLKLRGWPFLCRIPHVWPFSSKFASILYPISFFIYDLFYYCAEIVSYRIIEFLELQWQFYFSVGQNHKQYIKKRLALGFCLDYDFEL